MNESIEWHQDNFTEDYVSYDPVLGECVIQCIDDMWHKTIDGVYTGTERISLEESKRDFQAMKDKVVRAEIIQ